MKQIPLNSRELPLQLAISLLLVSVAAAQSSTSVRPIWTSPLGGDNGPIVVNDDKLFIGTRTSNGSLTELRCLSVATGRVLWVKQFERLTRAELDNRSSGIRSRPAIAGDRVVIYTNRAEVVCLGVKGVPNNSSDAVSPVNKTYQANVLWQRDLKKDFAVFKRDDLDTGSPTANCLIVGNRVYCATGNGSTTGLERFVGKDYPARAADAASCVCLSLNDGSLIWSSRSGSFGTIHSTCSTPLRLPYPDEQNNSMLVFPGGDGMVRVLSDKGGAVHHEVMGIEWGWSWHSPLLCGDNVVITTASPLGVPKRKVTSVFGLSNADLLGNDSKIRVKWQFQSPEYTGSMVPAIYSSGIVFILSENAWLLALNSQNGQLLWKEEIDYEALLFSEMLVSGNYLLVPVGSDIYVYEISDERKFVHRISTNVVIRSGMAIEGERLFLADSSHVYAFSLDGIPH